MTHRRDQPEEFRASLGIRSAVLLALLIWMGIGAAATFSGGLPARSVLTIAFFVLFFSIFVAYFWSMAVVVDEYGVTYRGATEFLHFDWDEITNLRDSEVPLGGYHLTAKSGHLVLSNFITERETLIQTIVQRAGLCPN